MDAVGISSSSQAIDENVFSASSPSDDSGSACGISIVGNISVAIFRFYGALHCEEPTEWISKNVIPVLNFPPLSIKTLQHRLCEYINQFSEVIFICDWPEDVMHLSKLLLVGGGQMLDIKPKMTFVIDSKLNSFGSVIPHNALEDALAIKRMA